MHCKIDTSWQVRSACNADSTGSSLTRGGSYFVRDLEQGLHSPINQQLKRFYCLYLHTLILTMKINKAIDAPLSAPYEHCWTLNSEAIDQIQLYHIIFIITLKLNFLKSLVTYFCAWSRFSKTSVFSAYFMDSNNNNALILQSRMTST